MKKLTTLICIMCLYTYQAEGLILNRAQRRDGMRAKQQAAPQSYGTSTTISTTAERTASDNGEAVEQSYGVMTADDLTTVLDTVTRALATQGQEKIDTIREESDPAFTPSAQFIKKQKMAREALIQQVIPRITKPKKFAATQDRTPGIMRAIDIHTIGELTPGELKKCLTHIATALTLLPPVPETAQAWAKAIVPLISFDAEEQEAFGDLITEWLTQLATNTDDLTMLLTATTGKSNSAKSEKIAALRKKYQATTHNASQLLYPWMQIASIINPEAPMKTFFQYATRNWKNVYQLYSTVVDRIAKMTKKSRHDASGALLLSMQTVFAPAAWEAFVKSDTNRAAMQ